MFEDNVENGKESVVKIAVVQSEYKLGDIEGNVAKCVRSIEEAADNGAKLIVLPELCSSGYTFYSREEVFAVSEPIPEGPTVQKWIKLAKDKGIYIAAGISESGGSWSGTVHRL